jgi:hypothetical protein
MAPWGVSELKRLGLLDILKDAGGVFSVRNIRYDENQTGEEAMNSRMAMLRGSQPAVAQAVVGRPLSESSRGR